MAERFTASNGWYVDEDGTIRNEIGTHMGSLGRPVVNFAIEYGRHRERIERDAELGRWRSKKHPNYFAVRQGNCLRVCDERMLRVWGFRNPFDVYDHDEEGRTATEVAREWFDAQEPPKPWLNAKPGEAWLLTLDGEREVPMTVAGDSDDVLCFWTGDDAWSRDDSGITAGRRIWPEEES